MATSMPTTLPRGVRTAWVVVGSVFAAAAIVAGALNIVDWLARHQVITTESFAGVTRIDIDVRSADIRVVPGDADQVTLTADSRYGLWAARHDWRQVDDLLTVRGGCTLGGPGGDCHTDLLVEVPVGTGVTVHTSHGRTTLTGLEGPVAASSSSGDIVVERLSGPLDLDSTHGSITATGITAAEVVARSSSGDIFLEFGAEPEAVSVDGRHGNVEIVVPDTPTAYRVDLDSQHGEVDSSVHADTGAGRSIAVRLFSGDITVRYP